MKKRPIDQIIFKAAEKIRQLKIDIQIERHAAKSHLMNCQYYLEKYEQQKGFWQYLFSVDQTLWKRLQDAQEAFLAKNVKIIEPPKVPKKRGRPPKKKTLLYG